MKSNYQIVRLRTETVKDLHRLKRQMGKASLDDLIVSMIQQADSRRLTLMNNGWVNTGGILDG